MADEHRKSQLYTLPAMPALGAALRHALRPITRRWEEAVQDILPNADELTRQQVRDTIPKILDVLIRALETGDPAQAEELNKITISHGTTRFHESYNLRELIQEYRLLRQVMIEEVRAVMGDPMSVEHVLALNGGIDIALEQGVTSFVDHQNERLKAAAESQARYLSFLSHDMRNNLNGIVLTLEVLAGSLSKSPEFKDQAEELIELQHSVLATTDGMNRLLQAERLRNRAVHVRQDVVGLRGVVDNALADNERIAGPKGLAVLNEVPPDASVKSDRELILLVLQNIVGNAVKYTPAGAVRVTGRELDEGGWEIAVWDEGPGIAPEQLDSLYDAFRRGDTHGQEGIGLGLSIASQAAKAIGARLSVQSKLGEGSTFRLFLPMGTN